MQIKIQTVTLITCSIKEILSLVSFYAFVLRLRFESLHVHTGWKVNANARQTTLQQYRINSLTQTHKRSSGLKVRSLIHSLCYVNAKCLSCSKIMKERQSSWLTMDFAFTFTPIGTWIDLFATCAFRHMEAPQCVYMLSSIVNIQHTMYKES